jgi:hypothetical protein
MGKRSILAAVLCAAVFAGGSVSAALAGEVKGPSGQPRYGPAGWQSDETGAWGA